MKFYVELAIAAVLLLLVYDKPTELTEFSNTILGKCILILIVGCVAKMRGMGAGLMAALVMLILLHDSREGFTEGAVNKKEEAEAEADTKKTAEAETKKTAETETKKTAETETKKTAEAETAKEAEAEADGFVGGSDIRVMEGLAMRNSYSGGSFASAFDNGYTAGGGSFGGLI